RWSALARFLAEVRQEPLDFKRQPPEGMLTAWLPAEQATLSLVVLYPRLALCELAGQFPLEEQEPVCQIGLQAGEQALGLAATLQDPAATAFSQRATGQTSCRQLPQAYVQLEPLGGSSDETD